MKVALVNKAMPLGGTTTFSLFLAIGLKELGIPIQVFSFSPENPLEGEFNRFQIPVYCYNKHGRIFEEKMADVLTQVRAFAPSCVIAGLWDYAFETLRYVPEGIFRVGMLQDHEPSVYKLAQTYQPFVDRFAAVSPTIQNEMAGKYPEMACSYLPYGVLLEPGAPRAPRTHEPLKILYFGRLCQPQKQVRLLPRIWHALKERQIPFQWTVLGKGPEEPFLREEMAEGVRAGEIVFSPPIYDREKLSRLIGEHDIFLLCSEHEGMPLALLETMGHGLVPVCGDIPSLEHGALSSENGLLVTQNEPAAYAEAIGRLHQDRNLLGQLSARASDTVRKEFTAVAMARRYVKFIEEHAPRTVATSWPTSFFPQPPLEMKHAWIMHRHLLPLRRLYKRLRP